MKEKVILREEVRQRIADLTRARDEFIAEANRQVAGFNAAIAELTALLGGDEESEEEAEG
jgi:hypothetical protein